MNGRIYDPYIGRFLSADPYIQNAGNLQSYNRYAYVLNNPLTFTDPSGFFLKKLARTVKKIWKNDVIQAAVTIATAVYGGPVAAAAYVGGKTAIDTGSISRGIKAGLITYGTAQAFQWAGDIGEVYGATARYAAHATVGCASSVANHGECGAGAFTSVMALAATGNLKPNRVYFNTAVHAVVGGTASVIAGGKFANGAITGSFGYLFNCLAHDCLRHYMEGSGESLDASFSELGADGVSALDFQKVSDLMDLKLDDGVYGVNDRKGWNTSSLNAKAAYGRVVLQFNGALIVNNGEYMVSGRVTALPDLYDFDPRPWGERTFLGEASTRMGNALPGKGFCNVFEGGVSVEVSK